MDYGSAAEVQHQVSAAPFQAPQESVIQTVNNLKALYFQREPKMLQKSYLITTIPKMNKEYLVSFDFKATSVENFANIVHFTTFDQNTSNTGARIPAVFMNNKKLF